MVTRPPLTPLERRAEFAKATTLHETTLTQAAENLGVSWTHLLACFQGERVPSTDLRERVAEYVAIPASRFWGMSSASDAA